LQHAVPAAGLIAAGVQALTSGAHGFELGLALVEVLTSVLLIRAIVQSFRASRAHRRKGLHHTHGVDWIDIWAAGVLFAEAAERWHLAHHIARPIILNALVTLGLGLFHRRVAAFRARRHSLRMDDAGVYVGGKPFSALRARWTEIADITVSGRLAEIRTRAGRVRRLNLADLEDSEAVRAALDTALTHLKSLRPPDPSAIPAVKA
jgi:hypothetical protein